jgi:hypothetical protein
MIMYLCTSFNCHSALLSHKLQIRHDTQLGISGDEMDGYQFIAAIFQSLVSLLVSLAWPAAFVIAVALFRGRLSQLLPLLRLKHKDTEVSFRLDQAEKEVLQIPSPPPAASPLGPTPEEATRFEQIAAISPRAAILEKRTDLEQTIKKLAEPYLNELQPQVSRPQTLRDSIRILRKQGIIDDKASALLDDLRVIGNQAAHEPDTEAVNSKVTAIRFGKLVDTVLRYVTMLS